jgi:hypothetical protein
MLTIRPWRRAIIPGSTAHEHNNGPQVDLELAPPVIRVGFPDRPDDVRSAGIVHQEIHRPQLGFDLGDHLGHRRAVSDIRTNRHDAVMDCAQFGECPVEFADRAGCDGDGRSASASDRAPMPRAPPVTSDGSRQIAVIRI